MKPHGVRIGGYRIRIDYVFNSEHLGQYDVDNALIQIDDHRPDQIKAGTLCHEIGHVGASAYSGESALDEGMDEKFSKIFEHTLMDLVRDNWEILEWIKLSIGGRK